MQTNAATSAAEGKRRCSEHSGASAWKVQSGKGGLGLNPGAAPLISLFPMALHCVLCGHQAVPCPGNAFRGRIVSLAQTYIKKWTTIAISASQLILTCYKFCTSEMLLQRAPETRAGCDTFAPSSAERCKCAGATTPGGELPQVLASVALVESPVPTPSLASCLCSYWQSPRQSPRWLSSAGCALLVPIICFKQLMLLLCPVLGK